MLPTKFRLIWLSGFREEDFFRNWPIRKKNSLWQPCLLADRDNMSNRYRGPSIDASYQVSVHLAKRFQRRRKVNGRRTPSDSKSSQSLWQGELKMDNPETRATWPQYTERRQTKQKTTKMTNMFPTKQSRVKIGAREWYHYQILSDISFLNPPIGNFWFSAR